MLDRFWANKDRGIFSHLYISFPSPYENSHFALFLPFHFSTFLLFRSSYIPLPLIKSFVPAVFFNSFAWSSFFFFIFVMAVYLSLHLSRCLALFYGHFLVGRISWNVRPSSGVEMTISWKKMRGVSVAAHSTRGKSEREHSEAYFLQNTIVVWGGGVWWVLWGENKFMGKNEKGVRGLWGGGGWPRGEKKKCWPGDTKTN